MGFFFDFYCSDFRKIQKNVRHLETSKSDSEVPKEGFFFIFSEIGEYQFQIQGSSKPFNIMLAQKALKGFKILKGFSTGSKNRRTKIH